MRVTLRKTVLALCVFALILGCAHVSFADAMTDMEAYFSQEEGYSGLVEVPGFGEMRYYAQNDPLWRDLIYEKEDTHASSRPFRDSGCSPTALAMAVANLVSADELSVIRQYAKHDFALCSCSVNKGRCTHSHTRYVISSQRDYERFLPLIFGDFAAGNNTLGVVSRSTAVGTGSAYLEKIAQVYGLSIRFVNDYSEAVELVGTKNASVMALAGKNGVFTTVGHYMYLAGKDGENLFIFDPLLRKNYRAYTNWSKVEVLQPGLVSMRHKDFWAAKFSYFIVLEKEAAPALAQR